MANPTTRLSPSGLDSFLQALNGAESANVLLRSKAKAQGQSTLSRILAQTIAEIDTNQVEIASRERLQLASQVALVCRDHVQLCTALLSDPSILSLSDVALKHYSSGGAGVIATIKAPGLASFRSALLAQVPTAVLCAVVSAGELDLAPTLKTLLVKVLSLAIQQKFNMSKGSLGTLVSQQEFQKLIPNPQERPGVRRTLERLQRLQNLVTDARDLKYLLKTPFASAQEIAAVEFEQVSEMLVKHNMPEDSINDVYSEAMKISRSSEQLFTDIIRARRDVPILAVGGKVEPEKPDPATTEDSSDIINLTTLFNDLDGVRTEDSTSVLSPAAYLVDLLELLKCAPLTKPPNPLPEETPLTNALQVLLLRRADLIEIELSKENTEVPVRYMDLAIEVMEAYIKRQAAGSSPAVTKADAEETEESQETQKNQEGNVSKDTTHKIVYQDHLAQQVYPMAVFPYNHAIACTREYLSARSLSRHSVLQMFRSDYALSGKSFGGSTTVGDVAMAKTANDRRLAAEYLGLQPGDFVAITQEAFQTAEFIDRLRIHHGEIAAKSYSQLIGAVSTAEYWGYDKGKPELAKWNMLDPKSLIGLSQVKLQLLRRAEISHTDLIRILKTRFLANRLVITVEQNGKYSDSLDSMRIQDSLIVNGDPKAEPQLSESTLLDLQAFIRLWRKLGWSIEDTDTAIVGLTRRGKPAGKWRHSFHVLDGGFIELLAAAKQLADLTGCAMAELMSFWGPMDASGPQSLYGRLFWSSGWIRLYPSLALGGDDDSTTKQPTIRDNLEPLLRALRMTQRDANVYMEILGIDYDSRWTLDHVSQLYRHHKMSSILGLTSSDYQKWYNLCLLDTDPYLDPQSTLSVVERWFRLRDDSIPIKTVVDLLSPSSVEGERPKESSLTFTRDLLKGLSSIHKQYAIFTEPQPGDDNQTFSQEALLTTCAAMCNADIAHTLVSIIEGTFSWQGEVNLPEGFTLPESLSYKCSQPKVNSIRFAGVLLDNEMRDLLAPATKTKEWADAVGNYYQAPRRALNLLSQYVGVPADVIINEIHQPAGALRAGAEEEKNGSDAPLSASDRDADLEEAILSRRKFVIQKIAPVLQKMANNNLVMTLLGDRFPDISGDLIKRFLKGDQAPSSDTGSDADSDAGSTLLTPAVLEAAKTTKSQKDIRNAFFFPPIPADYSFGAPDDTYKTIAVDKQTFTFTLSDLQHRTGPAPLKPDRIYQIELIEGGTTLTNVTFSSPQVEPQLFTPDTLCQEPLLSGVCKALSCLEQSLLAVELFQMDISEVEYFQSQRMVLSNLNVSNIFDLHAFTLYRRACSNTERSAPVRFLHYLDSVPVDAGPEVTKQLVAEIASLTKLTSIQVETYLTGKWPACEPSTIAKMIRQPGEIMNLLSATRMAETLGIRMESVAEWCMLPSVPTWAEDSDLALSLKMPLSSSSSSSSTTDLAANTASHSNQQRALQAYLLEMPFFRAQGVSTPDGLFKYFLIDVQMGSELQTTRIGQAIATVQLFVQRCLLGLEKKHGVRTNALNRSKWEWMSRFTLWQANRKVFLYPENWADPTLRDNQTEAFKLLQGKVLQNSLNLESINQMVREYIYSVNEIADLEIQSYLWESTGGSFRGKYHIFARTRTAPYIFYYRSLEVIGASGAQMQWNWFPWMKMDVEIPSYEVDGDNSSLPKPGTYLMPALLNSRLYLFMPQIIKKTIPSQKTEVTFGKLPKTKLGALAAQDYWEIKMSWTELRNGKWSPKQTTQTGIEVKQPDGEEADSKQADGEEADGKGADSTWVLPSISAFRFRLQSRSLSSDPKSTPILTIHVERLQLASTPQERQKQTHANIIYIGSFEMQGVRLRVSTTSTAPENTPQFNRLTAFSRFSHHSRCIDAKSLIEDVEKAIPEPNTDTSSTQVATQKEEQNPSEEATTAKATTPMPLLAVPNPPAKTEATGYDLSWMMAFDDTQNAEGTGLVVERSTASKVESFFGFPRPNEDSTAFQTQAKTTPLTASLNYGTAPILMDKATSTDDLESIYGTLENIPKELIHSAFGQDGQNYRELTSPSSIYTWELGFHVISLLVERLLATHQFDLALKLSRQVFDPTRNDKFLSDKSDNEETSAKQEPMSRLDYCWRFHPFKSGTVRTTGSTRDIVKYLGAASTSNDIVLWEANPFSAHSVARQRPVIYMKRFVIKCIEILIASGDHYFRQSSLEAIPLALQRYVEASELFGPAPQAINSPTERVTRTYAQIKNFVDAFANGRVDMELLFPYFINRQKQSSSQGYRHGTLGFVNSTYFSVPMNPQVQALRDLIDDRFYKIRHGLDIHGNPRRLPLFDPTLDIGQLVAQAANGGGGFGAILEGVDGPMPNYRSLYLLQKALELCGELKAFADSFLSVREKKDAEELSSLRARQDVAMQSLITEIKGMQVKESISTLQSLEETRKSHVTRLEFYLRLIGEPVERIPTPAQEWEDIQQVIEAPTKDELRMSPQEWQEMVFTEAAMGLNTIASALEHVSAGLMALPEIVTQTEPMGVGASMQLDASIAGKAIMMNANVVRAGAQASTDAASRVSRKAQMIRQLQDRRFQANQAGRDIKNIDKQIMAQKIRIQMAEAEVKSQQLQTANMRETEEYLRTKYTSQQLYAWMEVSIRQLFHQSYLAAMDMAKAAERAFAFEYGTGKAPQFLSSNGYWDASQNGLMAGQQLALALRRMEAYHIKTPAHDYELTKVISLRQIAPLALLSLRRKHFAEFQLPEVLFDQDFPGHYCRRIKTVSVLLPSVVGPYTGISSTLSLLEHRYRLKTGSDPASDYYGTEVSGDDRFRTDRTPITAIALSSTAQQDMGLFEPNSRDERYLPFEGAGVISRWRLELPSPYPQFDYDSISDVIFTVRYTALEGGAAWKKRASDAVVNYHQTLLAAQGAGGDGVGDGAFFVIDLLNDLRQEWTVFSNTIKSPTAPVKDDTNFIFPIRQLADFLPYWTRGKEVNIRRLWLHLDIEKDGWKESNQPPTILGVDLKSASESKEDGLIKLTHETDDIKQLLKDGDITLQAPCLNGKVPRRMWVVGQYTVESNKPSRR